MQCSSCGFENQEGMNFCIQCATPLAHHCPQCAFENPPQARFCGKCATPLTNQTPIPSPTPETQPVTAPKPPLAYTPQHLTEKILTSRSALEGERKQVTVCFADIKDSTELDDVEASGKELVERGMRVLMRDPVDADASHRWPPLS
jgi:hypothetical protein